MSAVQIPRCFGYARVSTEKQADDNRTSIADQRRAIMAKAESLGVVVDQLFADPGASGATVDRPGFQAMLAACKANRRQKRDPGTILILNITRLGRFQDVRDYSYWQGEFRHLGWNITFVEGESETKDPLLSGIVHLIGGAQSSEYRKNLQANVLRGMRGTVEKGYWPSREPFGYRRKVVVPSTRERVLEKRVPKTKDERVVLVPDAVEAPIVVKAFELYDRAGATLVSVANWMRDQHPALAATSQQALRYMLGNEAYLGHTVYGNRMVDPDDPKRIMRRTGSERWVHRDTHPAIVTQALFDRVAERLAANAAAPRSVNSEYLLTNVLSCEHCGDFYIGGGSSGVGQHIYRCSGTVKRIKSCTLGGVVTANLVDPLVVETLTRLLAQPAWQRRVREETERRLTELASTTTVDRRVEAELKKLAMSKERITMLAIDGTLTPTEAKEQLERIRGEIAKAEGAKVHQRIADARRATIAQERESIIQKVLDAPARIKAASGPALRDLIGFWCQSISYNKPRRVLKIAVRTVIPVIMASTVVAVSAPSSSSSSSGGCSATSESSNRFFRRRPAVTREGNATAGGNDDALGDQAHLLGRRGAVGVGEGNASGGIDDPMPGDRRGLVEAVQRIPDEPGLPGEPGELRDGAVRRDPSLRNATHRGENPRVRRGSRRFLQTPAGALARGN